MTLIIQNITSLVVHDVKVVVNNIILVVSTMTMTLKLVSPSPSKQCTAMHQSQADLLLSTFTASQLCSMHLYLYSYFHFFCICICMCIFCICIVLAPSINNMHQSQADLLSTFTSLSWFANFPTFMKILLFFSRYREKGPWNAKQYHAYQYETNKIAGSSHSSWQMFAPYCP